MARKSTDPEMPFIDLSRLDFMETRKVAELFDVSDQCVRNWASAGTLPRPFKVGRKTFVWLGADVRRAHAEWRRSTGKAA